MPRPS